MLVKFDPDDPPLALIRSRALSYPDATESVIHGRPWFLGPHGFAVYGGATPGRNKTGHPQSLLVRIEPLDMPARQRDPRFYAPAYFASRGWLGIDLDEADWSEIDELLADSFRIANGTRWI